MLFPHIIMIQVASSMGMVHRLRSGGMMELEGSGPMITFTAAILEEAWSHVLNKKPVNFCHLSCSAAPLLCFTQTIRVNSRSCLNPPRYTARLPFFFFFFFLFFFFLFSFPEQMTKIKAEKKKKKSKQTSSPHQLKEEEEEKRAPSTDKAVSSIINTFNLWKKYIYILYM
jgi:hypothetical protein